MLLEVDRTAQKCVIKTDESEAGKEHTGPIQIFQISYQDSVAIIFSVQ